MLEQALVAIERTVYQPSPEHWRVYWPQVQCELDLERVQAWEHWVVSGEYYPFEIQVAEWTVVVSSAGEAIMWVQNFPDSLIRQAREALKEVARELYSQGRPHFRARGDAPDDLARSEQSGEEE